MLEGHKFTDYNAVLDFLYTQLPMFQRVGNSAYKKDLTNTVLLCKELGNPQDKFKSIHVGGTNGKGSSSHYIAAILQTAGFKVGLYTSPHLKNFTERIKLNGIEMPAEKVMDFVNSNLSLIDEVKPSFFEITVAMAFDYFAKEQVDFAVIEVGMGGRLDSTNIIKPEVALITNISKDHEQWLGSTISEIAGEKAGIIKEKVPIVISEHQPESDKVFERVAHSKQAALWYAEDLFKCKINDVFEIYNSTDELLAEFSKTSLASYQSKNIPAVLTVIQQLNKLGYKIGQEYINEGITRMKHLTGLKGRWQQLHDQPRLICDVGHNQAGVTLMVRQLNSMEYDQLHIVWGSVNDKSITEILQLLPKEAVYYFCQANIPRALDAKELANQAQALGLNGEIYDSVTVAVERAKSNAKSHDLIFVGGSTFVVAELELD